MTDPQQTIDEHRVEIESHFLRLTWTALCSCGWRGLEQMAYGRAQQDAQRHLHEAKLR